MKPRLFLSLLTGLVALSLLGGLARAEIAPANTPVAAGCDSAVTTDQFRALLQSYDQAFHNPAQALQQLDVTTQITQAVFCAVGTPNYKSFLEQLNFIAPQDNTAYSDLAVILQKRWEVRYALGVALMQQQQMHEVSDYSWKLSVLVAALGLLSKHSQIGYYFYVAKQMLPVLIPGSVIGGSLVDINGMFDGEYPIAPADVLTLSVPSESQNYNAEQLEKNIGSAVASTAGMAIAVKTLGAVTDAITVGKFSFNPVTLVASLVVGEGVQIAAGDLIGDLQYDKLKKDLLAKRTELETAVDSHDEVQAAAAASALEYSAMALSSFLDTPVINAWIQYDQSVQTAENGRKWEQLLGTALQVYTGIGPGYTIPTPEEQQKAIAEAAAKRDQEIAHIDSGEDPVTLSAVQSAIAMNVIQQDPKNVSLLPDEEREQGQLIASQFASSGDSSYSDYIQGLETVQTQELAQEFRDGNLSKNPSSVLLETASFIQSFGDPRLSPASDDLLNALYLGKLVEGS